LGDPRGLIAASEERADVVEGVGGLAGGAQRACVERPGRADPGLESHPLGYTTFENAVRFVPTERDRLSYILVGLKSDADPDAVAARIGGIPGLAAHRPDELRWASVNYILRETGIGVNFGTTVALGLVVGLVITTATLYQFASDNLRHFAVLKAIGATRALLVRMILLQAMLVGAVGFGIGVGAASLFSVWGRDPQTRLTTFFPWQLLAGAFVAMLLCVSLGSLLSLRRVLTVEPAAVFQ